MRKTARATLLAAAALLAPRAFAQDAAPPAEEEAQPAAEEEELAQPAPEDGGGEIDGNDIVVTATKREETLQDIPVAVSVTTAETIERAQIRDLKDLSTLVPSLRINQQASATNTNFIIRGFGNGANNPGI